MAQRGRKSSASLAVVSPVDPTPRATPPKGLTAEQKGVWADVVNSLPADWFPPETLPLLVQYCRHTVQSNRLEQMIESYESGETGEFEVETYDRLLKMRQRESAVIMSLSTKMRLSQSSIHTARKGKGKQALISKPWQIDQSK